MPVPINYVEFKSTNLSQTKEFYTQCFGWTFTDYGPTYTAFNQSGIEGGFQYTENSIENGALIVLQHQNLSQIKESIIQNGGKISIDIFDFPGGKRFQFLDPSGNELAVWCEK